MLSEGTNSCIPQTEPLTSQNREFVLKVNNLKKKQRVLPADGKLKLHLFYCYIKLSLYHTNKKTIQVKIYTKYTAQHDTVQIQCTCYYATAFPFVLKKTYLTSVSASILFHSCLTASHSCVLLRNILPTSSTVRQLIRKAGLSKGKQEKSFISF